MSPRKTIQWTSIEAFEAIKEDGSRDTLKDKYVEALTNAGSRGLTDHEAGDLFDKPWCSVGSIRSGLMKTGFIVDSGEVRFNPSTGKRNKVWMVRSALPKPPTEPPRAQLPEDWLGYGGQSE